MRVRNTEPRDFAGIIEMTREVYPDSPPWGPDQLAAHLHVFPEGQFVAVDGPEERVVGMAAGLILRWDDYDMEGHWRDFTAAGTFANHDPQNGRTLYGAEVMVRPSEQRRGIGKKLYAARNDLVRRLGLLRIRAGARLRGYHRVASFLTALEYVEAVVKGYRSDPTLTFQLRNGFDVIAVVGGYLRHDPESLGWAAVIEWLNPDLATPTDVAARDPRFRKRGGS